MESLFTSPAVVAPAVATLLWIAWKVFLEPSVLPDLPIVGLDRSQWFAWPIVYYQTFHGHRELYAEANQKVCLLRYLLKSSLGCRCAFAVPPYGWKVERHFQEFQEQKVLRFEF